MRKANRSGNLLDPIAHYEIIASPLQGRDVSRTVLRINKRVAGRDLKRQTASYCEVRRDVESSRAQFDAVFHEETSARIPAERT